MKDPGPGAQDDTEIKLEFSDSPKCQKHPMAKF